MAVIELLICPASDPTGTPIETWTDADILDLRLEISLNDLGKNSVKIPRRTWEGSSLVAGQSYYCRVMVPDIEATNPFWGFWLVAGEFILVDEDERGGEDVTIGGPGPAWILTRAVLNYEERTDHAGTYVQDGVWYWENKNYGQILSDLVNEDGASPFPALDAMETPGWDNTNDVGGDPWEDFPGIFSQNAGTNYLAVIRDLQRAGNLDVWITPNLNMRAHVAYGRDLSGNSYGTGVVRFVGSDVTPDENRNVISELVRHKDGGKAYTHVLALGHDRKNEAGQVIEGQPIHEWAIDPDYSDGDAVFQGFIDYPTSSHEILERAGQRLIRRSQDRSGRMVSCEVMPGQDPDNGLYYPGAPGTDKGDYWIGDTVTFKTGGGDDFDLLNRELVIAKIRVQLDIAADDSDAEAKERSWHFYIETGDDVSPSSSAASSANGPNQGGGGGQGCHCPIHPDPGDPGIPPTAPTEDFRWSFTDRGGTSAANLQADGTSLHPFSGGNWEDGIGTSAWHDEYDAHLSWSEQGAITDYIPVTAGEIYTIEADLSQRQADSNVHFRVRWYTSGGTLLQTDYIAGPGVAVAVKTHYSAVITAPATATQIKLDVDAANGEFGAMDNAVLSHGGSGGTPGTPSTDPVTTVGGTGEGTYTTSDKYVPVGSILEHANIVQGGPYHEAADVTYDPTGSGLTATDVQEAIDELEGLTGGGGAPATADYLVGTAQGGLSAEIVVGTSPGGELGGTWASPTVDATHSGSTHAAATAAAHPLNSGDPHSQYRLEADDHTHASSGAQGGTVAHSALTGVTANQHHNEDHQSRHNNAGADALKLDDLATPDDNTDLNASTSRHGLLKKLDGDSSHFLDGSGAWTSPGGVGGAVAHSFKGYNVIGGTAEQSVAHRWILKKITLAAGESILSIDAYLQGRSNAVTPAIGAGVLEDNAGAPRYARAGIAAFVINPDNANDASAGAARWFALPVHYYNDSGASQDVWIGFYCNATTLSFFKDGSGADRLFTASAIMVSDAGFFTVTTTTDRYSIRAHVIS